MARRPTVKERLHKGYAQTMDVTKLLADEKSRYQRIRIFDTVANGRVMTLDDIVQITSRDESAYADMLTHLPMLEHGKVERVMIVGGGDLSIADEALKHKSVKEVVLVDIDGRVIELCQKYFAADQRQGVQGQAAQRSRWRTRSNISAARNRRTASTSSSPTAPIRWDPARRCSAKPSTTGSRARLKEGGYATFQTGVPFYQPWEITEALEELARFFPRSGLYLTVVPTYIGGFMALSWATKGGKPLGTPAGIRQGQGGLQAAQAQMRLLQSGDPCRRLRSAELDSQTGSLKYGAVSGQNPSPASARHAGGFKSRGASL